jgi:2-amino-4-hydroxy-6-hydroxymethyldihydropteridine diphosphokinase
MMDNRGGAHVYFSLGSNLGNRLANLTAGLEGIEKFGERIAVSSVVETPAWGYDDPNSYLNLVAHFRVEISPEDLHLKIKEIESAAGRRPRKADEQGYEARTLDIDILFYNDLILDTPELQIPHPRLQLRNFVLGPLAEIAPNLIHPVFIRSASEMLMSSPDNSVISLYAHGV